MKNGDGEVEGSERGEAPKLQPIRKPYNLTAISVLGLFILGIFYTLYFAAEFFLPVTLAFILSLILKPVVRFFDRLGIAPPLTAAALLLGVLAVVVSGVLLLTPPAAAWLQRAPETFEKVEAKLRGVMDSAERLNQAAESVQHIAGKTDETPKVELKKPGMLNTVWSQTKGVLVFGAEVLVLLFFFLAAGELFVLKLIQILPRLKDKKRALEIVRETEKGISQYLVAMTLVNLYEGVAIGTGLALLGLPNPLLWGVLAFFANYIPYLGALAAGVMVTVVALVSFDSTAHALIAPAIYFGVNFSDNFIAPYIFGRRLVLNPLIVFISVMFWGWIWGIPGRVLLAVPILITLKVTFDHVELLAPFGEFLTATREPERTEKPDDEAARKTSLVQENA